MRSLASLSSVRPNFGAYVQNVVVVVDIHDQISAVLFGEADAFVVNQAGVLDGVDAGANGILNSFGSVGVGGNLASRHVGGVGGRFQFLVGVLRRAGAVADGEHAAGGENLDHIHSILHLGADHMAHLVHAIRDLEVVFFGEHLDPGLRE